MCPCQVIVSFVMQMRSFGNGNKGCQMIMTCLRRIFFTRPLFPLRAWAALIKPLYGHENICLRHVLCDLLGCRASDVAWTHTLEVYWPVGLLVGSVLYIFRS